jgi:uncharacterized Zn-finger protein
MEPARTTDEYVKFKNDEGVVEINIGVREFKCAGQTPPFDHPHVYLNMGNDGSINCPYCSTKYIYRSYLGRHETEPRGNFLEDRADQWLP